VPVIINPQLLELYNGGLAIALKLPQLDSALIEKRPKFNVILNRSAIIRKRRKHANRRFEVVGMSDKAINLGVTMPIEYVKRFNTRFTSEAAGKRYHSVILKVDDQRKFPEIVREVKARDLTLADETENALKASRILLSIEAVFTLISLVIVAIAALNISQLFFMLIAQRRREIGLLRALGASPRDITQIILGEAAVIGVIGGALGALVGWLASLGVDQLVANLPRFPYKPETLFIFPWWTAPVGIGVAVVFCIIGAYFPGREAAKQEPAEALTQ
jgi:ABC-type lipoprotein release transport system permease subunit